MEKQPKMTENSTFDRFLNKIVFINEKPSIEYIDKKIDYFLKNSFLHLLRYSRILKSCAFVILLLLLDGKQYFYILREYDDLFKVIAIGFYFAAKGLEYNYRLICIIKEQDQRHKAGGIGNG